MRGQRGFTSPRQDKKIRLTCTCCLATSGTKAVGPVLSQKQISPFTGTCSHDWINNGEYQKYSDLSLKLATSRPTIRCPPQRSVYLKNSSVTYKQVKFGQDQLANHVHLRKVSPLQESVRLTVYNSSGQLLALGSQTEARRFPSNTVHTSEHKAISMLLYVLQFSKLVLTCIMCS